MTDTSEELYQFFDFLWEKTEGFVYLPILNRRTEEWKRIFFEWPKHRDDIVRTTLFRAAQGMDTYVAPAIFTTTSAKKENVLGTHVLWCEFDGNAPEEWAPYGLEGVVDPVEVVLGVIPPPSLRVQSSTDGHEHVYWKLNEFHSSHQWIEDSNRSIAYTFRADTSGWDVNQVLRPPGTTNYKHDDTPVTIRSYALSRYSDDHFSQLKPPAQLVAETLDTKNLPSVSGIIATYAWDMDDFNFFNRDIIQEGSRSSALMRLGFTCCEMGMADAEVYSILINADDRWGKFRLRNDRERRLLDIINRARQKYPESRKSMEFKGLIGDEPLDQTELIENQKYLWPLFDFLESDVKVEWIIEGLLERGGFGMVAASPGIGKTQFSIQLGVAAATGKKFLKWQVKEPMRVLFLSLEMSHIALKQFFDTIALSFTDEEDRAKLKKNFMVAPLGTPIPIKHPDGLAFLEDLLKESKPDLVIIDSLNKISQGELNEKAINDMNIELIKLRNKYRCSFWLIHHNRKANGDNKKPVELEDIYGSVFITAETSVALILWSNKRTSDLVSVIPVKMRMSRLENDFDIRRNDNLQFTLESGNDPVNREPKPSSNAGSTTDHRL